MNNEKHYLDIPLKLADFEVKHWLLHRNEWWKPIIGFESFYQVSSLGNIKSLRRFFIDILGRNHTILGRMLSPRVTTKKYLAVALYDELHNRKNKNVHTIVLEAFLGVRDMQVNHKNLNKQNNELRNLEYMTCRQNIGHFWKTKKRSSRFIGVRFENKHKVNKWVAYITLNGKSKFLGYFFTEIEAYVARLKYEVHLYSIGYLI